VGLAANFGKLVLAMRESIMYTYKYQFQNYYKYIVNITKPLETICTADRRFLSEVESASPDTSDTTRPHRRRNDGKGNQENTCIEYFYGSIGFLLIISK
jgi:hypothetical protein